MIFLAIIVYLPAALIGSLNNICFSIAADCVGDVFESVLTIVLFLFYWEAREKERSVVEVEKSPAEITA